MSTISYISFTAPRTRSPPVRCTCVWRPGSRACSTAPGLPASPRSPGRRTGRRRKRSTRWHGCCRRCRRRRSARHRIGTGSPRPQEAARDWAHHVQPYKPVAQPELPQAAWQAPAGRQAPAAHTGRPWGRAAARTGRPWGRAPGRPGRAPAPERPRARPRGRPRAARQALPPAARQSPAQPAPSPASPLSAALAP